MTPRCFSALYALCAAACVPDLTLPPDAQVSCEQHSDCPEGFRCIKQRCVSTARNNAPRIELGIVARALDRVTVPFELVDIEGDAATVSARVNWGTGFVTALLENPDQSYPTSDTGEEHHLVWRAAEQIGSDAYRGGVVIELTPSANGEAGEPQLSAPFPFGNDVPIVELVPVSGIHSGEIRLLFTVTDPAGDLVRVNPWFRVDGATWRRMDVGASPTTDLGTSAEGRLLQLFWASRTTPDSDPLQPQGLGPQGYSDQVELRLEIVETVAGVDFTTAVLNPGVITVNNADNTPPSVGVSTPQGVQTGPVLVSFLIQDEESDPCDVTVEYSRTGSVWSSATLDTSDFPVTGLGAAPEGIPHALVWQSAADAVGTSGEETVFLRIAAAGTAQGPFATTDPFSVNNSSINQPPTISAITPADDPASGLVFVNYEVADPEHDRVTITTEYRGPSGQWYPATQGGGGDGIADLSTSNLGVSHTFAWDTLADGVGRSIQSDAQIRITISQDPPAPPGSATAVSGTFTIDNTAALNTPPEVRFVGELPTGLGPLVVDLLYELSDAESDPVEVRIEYSLDGILWFEASVAATRGDGTTGLSSSPSGVGHQLAWDAFFDSGYVVPADLLSLRITPVDAYHSGSAVETRLTAKLHTSSPKIRTTTILEKTALPWYPSPEDMAITPGGVVHRLARVQDTSFPLRHRYSIDHGLTWVQGEDIDTLPSDDTLVDAIAMPDRLLVVYDKDHQLDGAVALEEGSWQWQPFTAPLSTTGLASNPHGATDAHGVAHVVWSDGVGGYDVVRHARTADGLTWSVPATLSSPSTDADHADLNTDPTGGLHVIWRERDTGALVYTSSSDGGITWLLGPQPTTTGLVPERPTIAADVSGDLFIAWMEMTVRDPDDDVYTVWSSTLEPGAGAWQAPVEVITDATVGDLEVGSDSVVHLGVSLGSDQIVTGGQWPTLYHSLDQGLSWRQTAILLWPWREVAPAQPRFDPDDGVLYAGVPSGNAPDCYTIRSFTPDLRGTWTYPYAFFNTSVYPFHPAARALPSGELEAVWLQSLTPDQQSIIAGAYAVTSSQGRSWLKIPQLFGKALAADIDATRDGRLRIVWVATYVPNDGTPPNPSNWLFYNESAPEDHGFTWGTEQGIVATDEDSTPAVSLCHDGNDVPHLVWKDNFYDPGIHYKQGLSRGVGTKIGDGVGVITCGDDDTLHVAARDGGQINYLCNSGAGWSTLPVASGADAVMPAIQVTSKGDLHVAWVDGSAEVVHAVSINGGTSWQVDTVGSPANAVALEADDADRLHIAWVDAGNGDVWYRSLDNEQQRWSALTWLGASRSAGVALASSANAVHALFPDEGVMRHTTTRIMRRFPAGLQAPLSIPDNDPAGVASSLSFDFTIPVSAVQVWIDLAHAEQSDLVISLSHDDGQGSPVSVLLQDHDMTGHTWRPRLIGDGLPRSPHEPLTAFAGRRLNGTWTLTIVDEAGGNTGTLRDWSLLVR